MADGPSTASGGILLLHEELVLGLGRRAHARARHTLKQFFDLLGAACEGVAPEVVARVLDELDEGDEQPPRVRAVDDEPLEQHPRDLLLHYLLPRLREEVQQHTREIVGVVVGVAQLVGDGIEQQIAALRVEVCRQALKDVHGGGVHHRGGARLPRLGGDGLDAHVQHQRVDERRVVAGTKRRLLLRRQQQPRAQLRQKGHWVPRLEVSVHLALELGRQQAALIRDDAGGLGDLREEVDLEVGREGVRQPHVPREGRQDEVAHLDARGRDDVAQEEVVLAQKLGEVVQEDEQHAEGAAVQQAD
mmetsp:Transcript_25033/g.69879  ORF Transcript_25033/g.69879 Transcript_25033/m.69879 type:complete len:303 (-) Transcript_25033:2245-3153(-)